MCVFLVKKIMMKITDFNWDSYHSQVAFVVVFLQKTPTVLQPTPTGQVTTKAGGRCSHQCTIWGHTTTTAVPCLASRQVWILKETWIIQNSSSAPWDETTRLRCFWVVETVTPFFLKGNIICFLVDIRGSSPI